MWLVRIQNNHIISYQSCGIKPQWPLGNFNTPQMFKDKASSDYSTFVPFQKLIQWKALNEFYVNYLCSVNMLLHLTAGEQEKDC